MFPGRVFEQQELIDYFNDVMRNKSEGSYNFDESTKVLLADPKTILSEYRIFIVGGKVITGAMYSWMGKSVNFEHVYFDTRINNFSFAQEIADIWLPHRNVVMDLALLDNYEWKVIEFNCINSSGFYEGHNIEKVFQALYEDYADYKESDYKERARKNEINYNRIDWRKY